MKSIQKIMKISNREERLRELFALCNELGVSQERIHDAGIVNEPVLEARIREAVSLRTAQRSWILALISCVVSVLSALVALVAVLKNIN
ncbi:MAG TPA: hypothetical protein DE315_06490 [Candidatus Omnitrophica bacterium]|nr:MAG: hypothetical protein A2Y05_04210 [Omnitrophica WOR_2 bacterium GWA2_53_43]HBO97461.1 hypothetical protein [Candidatus Omnitrophota bacterium]HCI45157.1 hypothetical protein [Candidatus Omnitrophota bacterium]